MEPYYSTQSAACPMYTARNNTVQDLIISPPTNLQQASITLYMLYLTIGGVIPEIRSKTLSMLDLGYNLSMTHVPRQIGKVAVEVVYSFFIQFCLDDRVLCIIEIDTVYYHKGFIRQIN